LDVATAARPVVAKCTKMASVTRSSKQMQLLKSQSGKDMKYHQQVRSDVKPFCCGLCGKDFKHQRSVKKHLVAVLSMVH